MPRATIDPNQTERHELATLPEGFVVVRRMSYGKLLDRQSEAMAMTMSGSSSEGVEADIKMMNRKTAELEFAECIVEHNLEDESGNLLDFRNPRTFDRMDPRIGEEIGAILNKINRFDDELGN